MLFFKPAFFIMLRKEEFANKQWEMLEPMIPITARRDDGRRPPEMHSDRVPLMHPGLCQHQIPAKFIYFICLGSYFVSIYDVSSSHS